MSACRSAMYLLSTKLVLYVFRVRMGVRSSLIVFFFQAEDGIRDLVRSRGLGDVHKRQSSDDNHGK